VSSVRPAAFGAPPASTTRPSTDGPDGVAPPIPAQLVAPWADDGRLTIALLGSDAGPGRGGDRLDAMLVVSVEVATGSTVVFSVDRYLLGYPMPEPIAALHDASCPKDAGWQYLNAAYRCFKERAPGINDLYPGERDPAGAAMRAVLGELLGLEVDHHVLVNMEGFVRGVDALGGVTVDLARPIDVELSPAIEGDPWIRVRLPAGRRELDGRQALAYVRNRKDTGGDRARMQRQRCLIAAIAERAEPTVVLSRYGAVLRVVEEHATTSLPLAMLPDLVELLGRIDAQDVASVGFGPPAYRGPDFLPDLPAIRERVGELLTDPARADDATVERGTEACT
jgi:polyisoprenyl-teichoic acid--peptidoglycan teichoic acid transferase